MIRYAALATLALYSTLPHAVALENGLGRTPAMGWNSWNLFACNIDENIVKSIADSLVSTGLRDLGYHYVTIDDCWQIDRNETGYIVADPKRFPSGMAALSEYIHSRGLKFGIYSSAGIETCEGRPGSLGYETLDAQIYASWGVDLLKYDNCANQGGISELDNKYRYGTMRDALNATGRPIYYAMCNWGQATSWEWASEYANSWRMSGDIGDLFDAIHENCLCTEVDCWIVKKNIGPNHCSVTNIYDKALLITQHSNSGGFNDLDMLEVGNGGMSDLEYRTHFSLWCALKSPLILGNNVANMTDSVHSILSNHEMIAINQDALGVSAKLVHRITRRDPATGLDVSIVDVISGPLANGDKVVLLFNRDSVAHDIELDLATHFGYPAGTVVATRLRDLWKHKDLGVFSGKYAAKQVQPHDIVVLRASGFKVLQTADARRVAHVSQTPLKQN